MLENTAMPEISGAQYSTHYKKYFQCEKCATFGLGLAKCLR